MANNFDVRILLTEPESDRVEFYAEISNQESLIKFKVFEVTDWNFVDIPVETKPYLEGTLNCDGTMHVLYGNNHFYYADKKAVQKHGEILECLYEIAEELIEDFENIENEV